MSQSSTLGGPEAVLETLFKNMQAPYIKCFNNEFIPTLLLRFPNEYYMSAEVLLKYSGIEEVINLIRIKNNFLYNFTYDKTI